MGILDGSSLLLSVLEKITDHAREQKGDRRELNKLMVEQLVEDMYAITDNYLQIFTKLDSLLDEADVDFDAIDAFLGRSRSEYRVLREKVRGFTQADFFQNQSTADYELLLGGIRGVLEGCVVFYEPADERDTALSTIVDASREDSQNYRYVSGGSVVSVHKNGYSTISGMHAMIMIRGGIKFHTKEEKLKESTEKCIAQVKAMTREQVDFIVASWGKICTAYANITGKLYAKPLRKG